MYLIVVWCFILTLSIELNAEICVLEPMVTIEHSLCEDITSCPNSTEEREKRENKKEEEEVIVYLKPGSPSLSHFGTIAANQQPSSLARSFFYKSILVAEETGKFCNQSYKYRTVDGSCNNLGKPSWGCTNSAMLRLLPSKYEANGEIKKGNLPLARVLSYKLFKDRNRPANNKTLAVMQWGQLIAHDTARSPSSFNEAVDCCESKSNKCCPIKIPENDPFFSQFNATCLNMVRTLAVYKTINCTTVPYQIAAVTQPIDLSNLYGSTIDNARSLREYKHGLLSVYVSKNGKVFPMLSDNPQLDCNSVDTNRICFHSSDDRVNQNTELTCLQTILLREHNRIAKTFAVLNPHWDDETLFQETRRILIAMYQHISYNEWLPLILKEEYLENNYLVPLREGYTTYKDDINLATINSFAAGAFRLFHSQIQGQLSMYNQTRCPFRTINISDWMNRPEIIMEGMNYDSFLVGLTMEANQKTDKYFTAQVTEMMFHGEYPFGEDLESFDIERGRDHGLPGYNDMRELCKLGRVQNFSELIGVFDEESLKIVSELYESVDDIDYFVGGVLEKDHDTMMCIIGEQFVRKKFGDRFWYEHSDQVNTFSIDQLQEIRKATFSRLLCDNGDNITQMQPNGFLFKTFPGNDLVPCSEIPEVNLTKWKEPNTSDNK